MNMDFQVKPVGDQAALVVFEQKIEENINGKVMALAREVEKSEPEYIFWALS